jgi:glycosyltransferase involved in cell wall biosynthesis
MSSVKSKWFRVLCYLEQISASFADHVIISNDIWGKRITERSLGRDKCSILINYPDPSTFNRSFKSNNSERDFFIYPGSLNRHQGLDIAIKAFHSIKNCVPNTDFYIYGDGPALNSLTKLTAELEMQDRVKFRGTISIQKIAEIMACAKCGVVPKRADLFGNEAFSTKVLEFMALGVPVVLSETDIDKYYFNSSQVLFFRSGDEKSLEEKLLLLLTDEKLQKNLIYNSLEFIKENNWDRKKHIYFSIVNSLMEERNKNS